jgi:GntR family transcriptional regulator
MESQVRKVKILDRHSPVPLYQQLSDLLAQDIKDGSCASGELLPSENELMRTHLVSRSVVRQALNLLSRQGFIFTEHGRGSFVSYQRIEKPLDVLQSYHRIMSRSGYQVDVSITDQGLRFPPDDIARQMDLRPGQKTYYLERVAYRDGSPLNLLFSHITPCKSAAEKMQDFPGGSLYDSLAQTCQIRLVRSRGYIEVIFAGENESRLLNVNRGAVLIQLMSTTYDTDGCCIEHARIVYPGSLFRFRFDSIVSDQEDLPRHIVPS